MTVPPPQDFPAPTPVLPKSAYTPWTTRLLGFLIDWSPIWLVVAIPFIGLLAAGDLDCINRLYGSGKSYCSSGASEFWGSVQFVALLPAIAYFFWNFCYRQGNTGQSIGK